LARNGNAIGAASTAPTLTPWIGDRSFRWVCLALGISHLAFATAIGLRWEHVAADSLLLLLPWLSITRGICRCWERFTTQTSGGWR